MRLEKWALIAEVVGSVAIVVTLVVLILELRTNTELARVAAYDSVTHDFDASREFFLNNADAFEIFTQYVQKSLPDPADDPRAALRVQLFLLNGFSMFERAYRAREANVFGETEWERIKRSSCQEWGYIQNSAYVSFVSFRLTDDFVDYLNEICTPAFIQSVERRYRGESAEGP
jgi:hypothetical protein